MMAIMVMVTNRANKVEIILMAMNGDGKLPMLVNTTIHDVNDD